MWQRNGYRDTRKTGPGSNVNDPLSPWQQMLC